MRTKLGIVSMGCIAFLSVACGDKGDESPAPSHTTGTAGTSTVSGAGGESTGGGGSSSGAAGIAIGSGGASAGSAGSGGSGGAGGGASMITKTYSFDTDTEGWKVQYTGATTGTPVDKSMVMVSHDATDGDPMPPTGSLEISIPFSAAGQNVDVATNPTGVDLKGKVVNARIKIVSGFEGAMDIMNAPPIARLYAKSGAAYIYANSAYNNLTSVGTWINITWNVSKPDFVAMSDAGTWDPSDVREIGVQLETSGTTTTAAPAVVRIDTVTY
jgi:hypothetical protein